ncbi:MAG: 30S ribosomal protein S6e [Candidatus Odinarchaeia archaeon]
MPEFKLVVSDPETGKSIQIIVKEEKTKALIGRKIGDKISGDLIGLPGYELEITGGSDKDGFPMRPDVQGAVRKRVLLQSPPGFKPKRDGERRRKIVRGNIISDEIVQINSKVVKKGKKPLEELIGVKEVES